MEKINTEILVSSLFILGFDKVDGLLFTYTLGQLLIDNLELQLFEFEDCETSQKFNEYVDYDGIIFKLKDGVTLKTNVSHISGYERLLGESLHSNKQLIEYLSNLNFKKIIYRKVETLGVEKINCFSILFSDKEKEIIGIEEPISSSKIKVKKLFRAL